MTQFGDFIEPRQRKVSRDAANEQTAYLRGNQPQPRQLENNPRDYDQVKVENGSGYPLDPFSILKVEGADAATWPERTNELFFQEGMRNGIESKGSQPGDDFDQVAVLQKSAPDTMFTQGVISGPTPVFVYFPTRDSLNYPFAIPDRSGNKQRLVASPYGLNRILWHAEPSDDFQECAGEVLQAYVNLGEDQQWHFWKLKSDLSCCGSAPADACTECGTVYSPDCPITRTIWAPKGLDLCGCENACGQWKQGDVVPAWWYESLEKWVTIPNFNANLEEKELEVVTSLQITGGTVTPASITKQVATDLVYILDRLKLCDDEDRSINCSGNINFGNDAKAKGKIEATATLGSQETKVRLPIVSECNTITIANASLTSTGNLTLSGTPSSATVTVPLSGVSLPVTGTCDGDATVFVQVDGINTLNGACNINNLTTPLPQLDVTGDVIRKSSGDLVTLESPNTKTFMTGVTTDATKVTAAPKILKIPPLQGTLSGSLTTSGGNTINITNFSGLHATVDLSDIFEAGQAVKSGTLVFDHCRLYYDPITVLKFKDGKSASDLQNIPVSISGQLSIPSDVSCNFNHSQDATEITVNEVTECKSATFTPATDSITAYTSATLQLAKIGINGQATFPQNTSIDGTCHVQGNVYCSGNAVVGFSGSINGTATGDSEDTATGTVSFTQPLTVSGQLNLQSGVTLSGNMTRQCAEYAEGVISGVPLSTTTDVSLNLSGAIVDNRICTVKVPTGVCQRYEDYPWIWLVTEPVPFPGVDLTGATISGTTSTIKYLACAECLEPEEEEEEETPNA